MRRSAKPQKLQGKMFRGTTAVRRGWLTPNQLRGSAWHRIFRDVYVDSAVEITHRVRCLAVIEYLAPKGTAIAGRSAAHLLGVSPFDLSAPVEVISPVSFGPISGIKVHRGTVEPADIVDLQGIRATSPVRTCADLATWLDETETVVFVDMLAARCLVQVGQLQQYALSREGTRGADALRRVARLVDAASQSPQETRLRLALGRCGLPRFVAQYVITHEGRFVARVDLALPELRIAVEYDGGWHATQEQLELDRRRLNRLVGAGWTVIHVTAGRLRTDLSGVVQEIRTAIRAQGRPRS